MQTPYLLTATLAASSSFQLTLTAALTLFLGPVLVLQASPRLVVPAVYG